MTDEELARRRDQVLTAYRKNKSTKVQPSVIDEEDDPYWPPRPMNHSQFFMNQACLVFMDNLEKRCSNNM